MTRYAYYRISFLLLLFFCLTPPVTASAKPAPPAHHELTYAYFPMAVPVAVLAEILKRDRILSSNLAKTRTTLRFLPLTKGKEAAALIQQDKIDALCFSDNPVVESSVNGKLAIVGMVKQSYSAVVAPLGARMSGLRNKRVGSVQGATSHYALLQGLAAIGLSDRDLHLFFMEVNELPDALLQGKIDAFAAWEPTPSALLANHPGRFSQIYRQTSYSYFVLSRRLLERHPAAAHELSAAILRAVRWMKKDTANLALASRWTVDGIASFTGKPPLLSAPDVARITAQDLLDVPGTPLFERFRRRRQPVKTPV